MVLPLLLLAAGMALVVAPLTTAVMNAAPDALAGAASGVNNAASRLAGLFAVALTGAIAALVFAATVGLPEARFGVFPPAGDPALPAVAAGFRRGLARRDGSPPRRWPPSPRWRPGRCSVRRASDFSGHSS